MRTVTLFAISFQRVFINWGTCFARTRLLRQLPICLVYMLMRILIHLYSSCLLIKYFSFYFVASIFWLLHLSFDCIVAEIVSFLSSKISGQEFPDSQFILSIFVDMIFVIQTSSTRLEYWIHLVLMNLQDVGQTGIEVAQHKCRATAVQVCGLNPAGWSILWTHGL